jgi:hypothetical protein
MNLKITAEKQNQIPKVLKTKWNKKLAKVKSSSDKVAIILLAEILEILSNNSVDFNCTGVVDYGMFSDCDYSWTLSAAKYKITRTLSRDISESWQRVEEFANDLIFKGLENFNFNWNGESGGYLSTLEIQIELKDNTLAEKIITIGKLLFEDFDVKY